MWCGQKCVNNSICQQGCTECETPCGYTFSVVYFVICPASAPEKQKNHHYKNSNFSKVNNLNSNLLSHVFYLFFFFFFNCYYVQMLHKCNLWQDVTRLNGSVLTLTISTSLLKASCMFSWTFWCVLTFLGASQGFIWQEIWRELTAERATGRSWTRAAAARTQSVHGGRMLKLLSHCFRFLPG